MKKEPQSIVIISSSPKTLAFWNHHLEFPNVKIWNLNTELKSNIQLQSLKPCLFVLDEYYEVKENLVLLVDSKIGLEKIDCPILHLSPRNSLANQMITSNAHYVVQRFVFSHEFITEVKRIIHHPNLIKTVG